MNNKEEQMHKEVETVLPMYILDKRKKRYIICGIALFLIVLFLLGFFPRFFQTERIDAAAALDPLPKVCLQIAKPDENPVEFVLPSSTQADHITPIWARANGYLDKLLVDIGDVVKEGQLLAILATPEIDDQYRQAVHDLETAKSNRDIAQITAERWQQLYNLDERAISKETVDQNVAAFVSAEATVRALESNVNYFKDLMDFKYIVAPFDGIIIERNVDLGSLITPGSNGQPQQLFQIVQTNIIRMYVNVPQYYVRSIHDNLEAVTKIREFPNKNFKSAVARYAKALDPVSRTMLTELHIDNRNGELYAGLFAEVSFLFKPEQPYFVVPGNAVIIRAGDPKIAVLDDNNVVHIKPVTIGVDYGKNMQIISGLETNDRVITNPTEKIREGVKVQVLEQG